MLRLTCRTLAFKLAEVPERNKVFRKSAKSTSSCRAWTTLKAFVSVSRALACQSISICTKSVRISYIGKRESNYPPSKMVYISVRNYSLEIEWRPLTNRQITKGYIKVSAGFFKPPNHYVYPTTSLEYFYHCCQP